VSFFSLEISKTIEGSFKEAKIMGDEYISTEHILLSLMSVSRPAKELLEKYQVTSQKIMDVLKEVRGNQKVDSPDPEGKYQVIEKYTVNPIYTIEGAQR